MNKTVKLGYVGSLKVALKAGESGDTTLDNKVMEPYSKLNFNSKCSFFENLTLVTIQLYLMYLSLA
jgi:hypothetical protein